MRLFGHVTYMIQILLIAIFSLLAQLVLPWWSIAVVAFIICFWRGQRVGSTFWQGFAGIAAVWLVYALLIHSGTDGVFTGRMSELLFNANNATLLLVAITVLSGLVGGLAGLSGFFVRQAIGNQMPNNATNRPRS